MTYRTESEACEARCCGPEGCGTLLATAPRLCIASACMAWRWAHDETNAMEMERAELEGRGYRPFARYFNQGVPMLRMRKQTEYGFCGLAGAPQ